MNIIDELRNATFGLPYKPEALNLCLRAADEIERQAAENDRLRACLQEAVMIAVGSGADYTPSTVERLDDLKRIADQQQMVSGTVLVEGGESGSLTLTRDELP